MLRKNLVTVLCLIAIAFNCRVFSQVNSSTAYPFWDVKLPLETRLNDLVKRLTMDEKINMLWETSMAIDRLGIDKYYYGNEGLHGVMRPGKFTVFPQSIALAATWDTTLMYKVATAISDEARGRWNELEKGKKQLAFYSDLLTLWSPTINMARDPRWGRTAETYGEDPFLTSRLSVAYIKGLQGNDKRYIKVVATPKHLAANNEENNRLSANAIISEKTLREYYLPAFKASIVEAKAQSIMSAYNRVNWIPSSANRWLLKDVLRNEWGFEGFVVADCGAACNIFSKHHFAGSYEEAAAAAIKAGMDLECSGGCTLLKEHLIQAFQQKLVTDDEINNAVKNVLRVRFKLGLFDKNVNNPYDTIKGNVVGSKMHQQLALEAAEKSIILLKNDRNILPLDIKKIKSIAVIGHNANINVYGGYSGEPINAPVTPLQGIKNIVGDAIAVNFVPTRLDNFNLEMVPSDFLQNNDGAKGLDAEYFTNKLLEGSAKKRVDAQINLNYKDNPPDPYFSSGDKSVRWTGWLVPPTSGEYLLGVSSDDGARMWFDGEQKINSWVSRGEILDSFKVKLEAGKRYPIKIEYFDLGGDAVCRFWWRSASTKNKTYVQETAAAKKSDVVIAVVGTGLYNEREGHDKESLNLPGDQLAMLKAVYKENPNMVVVMVTGSQYAINWIKDIIPGIINAYFTGEQEGAAIANVLFGKYNPSGKVPLTYYESLDKVPAMDKYEIKDGRTYMYYSGHPLYEFGYGLSYTSFNYTNFSVKKLKQHNETVLSISLDVHNTGSRDGEEVVQLYSSYPNAQDAMPINQLKGFKKVFVPKGEKVKVSFTISSKDISFWNDDKKIWQAYKSHFLINIGASSKDIGLKKLVTFN